MRQEKPLKQVEVTNNTYNLVEHMAERDGMMIREVIAKAVHEYALVRSEVDPKKFDCILEFILNHQEDLPWRGLDHN